MRARRMKTGAYAGPIRYGNDGRIWPRLYHISGGSNMNSVQDSIPSFCNICRFCHRRFLSEPAGVDLGIDFGALFSLAFFRRRI